ncbi:homeobox protein prospero-like isoform X5 [Portunus trituberculatus]|uniref:homeobox protein prospero-like isoform X5 n=1 Tax=Portunus trituberculatus TaxID=210409 RepID=UPI001E1D20AC|nr:homeobox protein prospero-like isoform X5 [Portunus trituberculatus]
MNKQDNRSWDAERSLAAFWRATIREGVPNNQRPPPHFPFSAAMNHHLPPGQERLFAARHHQDPFVWSHAPRRHTVLKGVQRCFPRPFMDNLRPPQFRAPDEPSSLIGGGLRIGTRDVAPPYWPPLPLAPPTLHPPPIGALPTVVAHDEESDCFMLGEKLSKKPKRIRTRVDAGEPRNSYSAFSSLPNLCGVSVNAVRPGSAPNLFSASQSFCGLPFVNYFNPPPTAGSRGMLSELFGAHTKPVAPCPPEDTVATMGVLDKVTSSNVHSADAVNSVIRGPEADNVLLREILQGRKREILTMEEIEAARSLHNNNNSYKGAAEPVETSNEDTNAAREESVTAEDPRCESEVEETMSQNSPRTDSPEPRKRLENIVSVIRSSPTPNTTVNGCKKRKLYLPQQHEARNSYDSQTEEGEAAAEPDNKTRRLEEDEQVESRAPESGEEGGLQIDLSVRRRSPETQRAPSPKPPTSTSSSDSNDASSYLLDYAQRLIRTQEERRRENELKNSDLTEKLQLLRNLNLNSQVTDLEGLADVLKTEITASLAVIIDTIVNKYVQQKKLLTKQAEVAAEQLNRDIASQLMEGSRSPRSHKMLDRTPPNMPRLNGMPAPNGPLNLSPYPGSENSLNNLNLPHLRPPMYKPPHFFQGSLPPMGGMIPSGQTSPYGGMEPEQDEALPLVVTPKKKRHKVTDSRLTPRTVGRLLEDFPRYGGPLPGMMGPASPRSSPPPPPMSHHPHHRPSSFPQPPPLLPVSLPTSVAIPNPSLHESNLLYPGYYSTHRPSSPLDGRRDESPAGPPPPHHHPLLHPALLAASSPDTFSRFLHGADHDRASDCSPADPHYDGVQPTISFYSPQPHSSTLTPMHLRKAKLMFFFVRYPSSSVLKTYFPDIKFNKNNTAQLVKWFSNFREFYYIQMEKYARQSLSEGTKNADDISVTFESEIIRALNLHYNRNNHLEIPEHFRYVVEQTLREFFKAIQEQKDQEQSWKKAIYKIIARLDEQVPEYFKSPTFLEQLE